MFQETPNTSSSFNINDWIRTIATVLTFILSVVNLFYAVIIFYYKDKKEDVEKKKDLNVGWFKSLILDYNLEHFYNFFQDTEKQLEKLKSKTLTHKAREKINETIKDYQSTLRKNFIDMLLAVDEKLYSNTINELDKLIDHFTEVMFDTKINLSHQPSFEEEVAKKLTETRTNILKMFFDYKG